jgi:hypothetical protein
MNVTIKSGSCGVDSWSCVIKIKPVIIGTDLAAKVGPFIGFDYHFYLIHIIGSVIAAEPGIGEGSSLRLRYLSAQPSNDHSLFLNRS